MQHAKEEKITSQIDDLYTQIELNNDTISGLYSDIEDLEQENEQLERKIKELEEKKKKNELGIPEVNIESRTKKATCDEYQHKIIGGI